MARSFALIFSLLRYAAFAAGVVGFGSSSSSSSASPPFVDDVEEDEEDELEDFPLPGSFFFVLTPALVRRGLERATEATGAAASTDLPPPSSAAAAAVAAAAPPPAGLVSAALAPAPAAAVACFCLAARPDARELVLEDCGDDSGLLLVEVVEFEPALEEEECLN